MITLQDLNLKDKVETITISINNTEIEVKQYVGIQDKISIVNIAIQESLDANGLVIKPLAEALVSLYAVYLYSNIVFSPDEKDSPVDTYNTLERNGIIDAVVSAIPQVEYETLIEAFEDITKDHSLYRMSSASAIIEIFQSLPNMIDAMNTGLEDFDLSKLTVLDDVMKTMGGNEAAVTEMLSGQK